MSAYHNFMFIGLPYMAAIVFVVVTIYRFRSAPYKISSLSSQFLEGKLLFWGSVPFHTGMGVVFIGHLIAFLIPGTLLTWNSYPLRLIILEVTGFAFALSFLFGLVVLFIRRVTNARIRVVTSWMDILIELLLLYQVASGCIVAVKYRWGSSWFASDMAPYLWSLVKLDPHIDAVKTMPPIIQSHVVVAFIIIFIFPFTRLIHFFAAPVGYFFRPYQQVIWNWNRKTINRPDSAWTKHKPKNT